MTDNNLLDRSTRLASIRGRQDEAYAWISDHELLLLRPNERRGPWWDMRPFVAVTQFFHSYEAFHCDVSTGQLAPLVEFNRQFSRHLAAMPMHMRYLDENGV